MTSSEAPKFVTWHSHPWLRVFRGPAAEISTPAIFLRHPQHLGSPSSMTSCVEEMKLCSKSCAVMNEEHLCSPGHICPLDLMSVCVDGCCIISWSQPHWESPETQLLKMWPLPPKSQQLSQNVLQKCISTSQLHIQRLTGSMRCQAPTVADWPFLFLLLIILRFLFAISIYQDFWFLKFVSVVKSKTLWNMCFRGLKSSKGLVVSSHSSFYIPRLIYFLWKYYFECFNEDYYQVVLIC